MFQSGMGSQDRVVRFNNGVGQGGSRVHAEFELRLLAVVGRQPLKDEGTETGTSSTAEGVEDEEALKTRAVVCEPANLVHDEVDLFLTDRVVATGIYATL